MSVIKNIIITLMLMTQALAASALDFTVVNNVSYKGDSERQVLDIYHPTDTSSRLPVVIWFHGGCLTGGFKYLPQELQNGEVVIVAPEYRLIPAVTVNECIDDAAAATAWVMDNIDRYGGDPDNIYLSGHSAGGYLTSMVGLDKKWLAKYDHDPDSLAALVPFSGQVITHFSHRESKGVSPLTPMVDELAPLFYVRPDCPPYIIITGDSELELYGREEENAYMWRMMKLVGHPQVYIYKLDGYNHGDMPAPAFHIMKNHIKDITNKKQ